ncbi:putative cytochrome P450 [Mycobacterium xenopi 3993]|nr:putative cytochrome P450 [Mycobacterium xenopi 3993]
MTRMSWELRRLIGDGLLVVPHREWRPRRRALQSVFAEQHLPGSPATWPRPRVSWLVAGATAPKLTWMPNAAR